MLPLKLDRPLVVLDVESTGLEPDKDRIVQIGLVRFLCDRTRQERERLINPGVPIPAEATEIHGISNEDVADAPTFHEISKSLLELLAGCDLGGYACLQFDLAILDAEFRRCGLDMELATRKVVDVQRYYHHLHPRHLENAVEHYCEREHDGAHTALADARATADVLEAMLLAHPDELPRDVEKLDELARDGRLDVGGWFRRRKDGVVVYATKRNRGIPVGEDTGYLDWILRVPDIPSDSRAIGEELLKQAEGRLV